MSKPTSKTTNAAQKGRTAGSVAVSAIRAYSWTILPNHPRRTLAVIRRHSKTADISTNDRRLFRVSRGWLSIELRAARRYSVDMTSDDAAVYRAAFGEWLMRIAK